MWEYSKRAFETRSLIFNTTFQKIQATGRGRLRAPRSLRKNNYRTDPLELPSSIALIILTIHFPIFHWSYSTLPFLIGDIRTIYCKFFPLTDLLLLLSWNSSLMHSHHLLKICDLDVRSSQSLAFKQLFWQESSGCWADIIPHSTTKVHERGLPAVEPCEYLQRTVKLTPSPLSRRAMHFRHFEKTRLLT